MITIDEMQKRLLLHEGCAQHIYTCPAGYKTIGIGRNLETNPLTPREKEKVGDITNGITLDEAIYLLRNDIKRCEKDLNNNISWFYQLDDERQYALLDMCFNMGIKKLLGFKRMLNAMLIGDYRGAAKECLNSKYARDVGKRAKRIAHLIETGIWVNCL